MLLLMLLSGDKANSQFIEHKDALNYQRLGICKQISHLVSERSNDLQIKHLNFSARDIEVILASLETQNVLYPGSSMGNFAHIHNT